MWCHFRIAVNELTVEAIKELSYIPVALALENSSSSGIRNLYVELDIVTTSQNLEITQSPWRGLVDWPLFDHLWPRRRADRDYFRLVEQKLAKFDPDKLQK